ncbi:MAG: L-threonylcarbamoyladenylate synthase [Sediminibacterium sp.]
MTPLFNTDIEACLRVLESGGLILYPTDTIWGIGCDATNEAAVEKIFALKKRIETKALIVLIADERSLLQYVASPHIEVFDYIQGVSKPTTIIYENAIGLAGNLLAEDGSVGIRICADEFCKHLIKRFRKPIVSTSANISGFPPPKVFSDIDIAVKQGVDYVVHYRQDDTIPVEPSAVVKCNKDGSFTILRP